MTLPQNKGQYACPLCQFHCNNTNFAFGGKGLYTCHTTAIKMLEVVCLLFYDASGSTPVCSATHA